MRKRLIAAMLFIAMLSGILSGCSPVMRADASRPMNGAELLKNYQGAQKVDFAEEAYLNGLNQFSYKIFNELSDEDNVFISPYSIALALSMVFNGADNETREEMAGLLGFDKLNGYTGSYSEEANHYLNANAKYLIDSLQKADPKVKLRIANSIWMATGNKFSDSLKDALLSPVRFYYDADIYEVDFTEDATVDYINKWVADKTDRMIDPFLESFSNKNNLRMFLANAIYFNGEWSTPFKKDQTRRALFHGTKGSTEIDMMHMREESFRYYSDKGMKGIELPYGNGSLVMNILLPETIDGKAISERYSSLNMDDIDEFLRKIDASEKTKIDTLELPRFEMEYGLKELNDALKQMGMEKAFLDGEADFSLIGEDIFIGTVMHKAKIQVEEWGTKAAAATGIELKTTSFMPVDEPINFIVNIPFVFFIRDSQTGAVLFAGGINQLD